MSRFVCLIALCSTTLFCDHVLAGSRSPFIYPIDKDLYNNNLKRSLYDIENIQDENSTDDRHLADDIGLKEESEIYCIGDGRVVIYRASEGYGELVAVVEHDLGEEVDIDFLKDVVNKIK